MSSILTLLLCWALVFVMNIVPAFMPPTWSVLAYFRIVHNVPLLPTTVGGAAMSALGRMQLARLSSHLQRFLSSKDQANAKALAAYITAHPNVRDAVTFAYALGPLPSNQLFIAAGIARIPLRRFTLVWCAGVTIGDTFWVWTAGKAARDLRQLFAGGLTNWRSVVLQLVGMFMIWVLFHLPWAKWLGLPAGEAPRSAGGDEHGAGNLEERGYDHS